MDIDVLISLVFSRPPVWDKRNKKHANRYVVDKCWREISAEMNEDENKLRKKWKYLRDQFSVEYGKIPISRSGDGASTSYEPKWPYYHSLLFLKDVVQPRKSLGNLSKPMKRLLSGSSVEQTNDSSSIEENSNPYQEDSNDPQDIEAGNMQHDTSTCDVLEENSEDTNSNIEFSRTGSAVPRKKRTNTFNENLLDIEKKKLEYLQQKARRNDDDEHLLFLKSLLPHIRKIPQNRLLSFRNDIQRTVDFYAYQSQFPRSPSSGASYSLELVASPTGHLTPEPHASQSVEQALNLPPITRQTPEPHASQSVAHAFLSPPITRQTPESHASQSVAQAFHLPPITRQTPEPHASQSVAQAFHSPPITRQTPESHASQSEAQAFHSPPITRQTPEPHASQSVAQAFQSQPIILQTQQKRASQSVTQTINSSINTYLHSFSEGLSDCFNEE